MTVYGYARVSTIGQTLAVQEASLHEAGAAKVFKEKISGAASNRAQLYRLLKLSMLGALSWSRDWIGWPDQRETCSTPSTGSRKQARPSGRSATHGLNDHGHGRVMLKVLGGLAEFERELIRVRTGEGRVRAKARGVHMGRPLS